MDVVMLNVVVGVSGIVLALLGFGVYRATGWLKASTHNEQMQGVWDRLSKAAMRIVADVNQSYVEPLKKAGKWNDETAAEAKKKAIEKLRSYVGPKGLGVLAYVAGFEDENLDDLLETFVESEVGTQKAIQALVPRPLPDPAAP